MGEVAVIMVYTDNKEAIMTLAMAKNNIVVFRTFNEKYELLIKKIFGNRDINC